MKIQQTRDNDTLTIALGGRLDTVSAPELEELLGTALENTSNLIFDLKDLEYMSSAGLRLLLSAQKKMTGKGEMKIIHASDIIMEIFEVTGFTDILTIEKA